MTVNLEHLGWFTRDLITEGDDGMKKKISLRFENSEKHNKFTYLFLNEKEKIELAEKCGYKICLALCECLEWRIYEDGKRHKRSTILLYWYSRKKGGYHEQILDSYDFQREGLKGEDCSMHISNLLPGVYALLINVPVKDKTLHNNNYTTKINSNTKRLVLFTPEEILFPKHEVQI